MRHGKNDQQNRPRDSQKTAKALGEIRDNEVTRIEHGGKHVQMKSTISNKPIKQEPEVIIYSQKKKLQ